MSAGFDSVIGKPYLKEDLVINIQAAAIRGSLSKSIWGSLIWALVALDDS